MGDLRMSSRAEYKDTDSNLVILPYGDEDLLRLLQTLLA